VSRAVGPSTGITRAEEERIPSTIWWRLNTSREYFMTTDPVCGMKVDDQNPQHQAQYGGHRYSFCSQQCKNEFEQNPEEYAAAAAA
jgi:YHS domain-containing protein